MYTRPISPEDFVAVLALNEESVRYLSPLSSSQLARLHVQSAFHRVVEEHGRTTAFILAFRQGVDYESVNYQWFARRYRNFLYIDRVVVSQRVHGKGVGSLLYREVFRHAQEHHIPVVACEFDVEPPNLVSAQFHAKFGFAEVARQPVANGSKIVSLQIAGVRSE